MDINMVFEYITDYILSFAQENPALAIIMGFISMYIMPRLFMMSVRMASSSNQTTSQAVNTIDDSVGVISQLAKSLTEGLKDLTAGVNSVVLLLKEDTNARKELAAKEGELLQALTERIESVDKNVTRVEVTVGTAIGRIQTVIETALEKSFERCANEMKDVIKEALNTPLKSKEDDSIDSDT